MNSDIDEYLDEVGHWKQRVHEKLKGLTSNQRAVFWARVSQRARRMDLLIADSEKRAKPRARRIRRTG